MNYQTRSACERISVNPESAFS